jgi:dihydropyrimidine dehydrogenase (NAD+) subunit PreT
MAAIASRTESPGVFDELVEPLEADEALVEADRCLECGGPYAPAPCLVACPAGVDVASFVGSIARGDPLEAARTIFEENLLGGTCARVCPVEMLCEGACVLEHEGRRPVAVGRLQWFAAEEAFRAGIELRQAAARNGRRVAVIGAGPAGLVCAGELATLGYQVAVYDEREEAGGLVRYAIAPYRQQCEPLPDELHLLQALGVELHLGERIGSPERLREIGDSVDAVFLGIGMGEDVDGGSPGQELEGVWRSLDFIEAIKTGRAPEVGRRVAVIGGGNTAIDVAREAVRLGASEVTLLYRRTETDMPAYAHEVEEAREEGVRFEWLTVPVRFLGRGRLKGIECRRARLGEPDESGRPRPEPVAGSEFVLHIDTAVKAIGQRPRAEFLAWIDGLGTERGIVVVDPETGQTGNPKFFAAGDTTNGGATVVEAVGGAKIAAGGIHAYLEAQR